MAKFPWSKPALPSVLALATTALATTALATTALATTALTTTASCAPLPQRQASVGTPPAENPRADTSNAPSAQPTPSGVPTPPASEAPRPEPEASPDLAPAVRLPGNLVFAPGSATLSATQLLLLGQLRDTLRGNPRVSLLRIEGHSDDPGDAQANLKLSGARALAVLNRLVDEGAPAQRLVAVGYGTTRPLARNGDPAGRAQNRRVEFSIVELDGAPFAGRTRLEGGLEFRPRPSP